MIVSFADGISKALNEVFMPTRDDLMDNLMTKLSEQYDATEQVVIKTAKLNKQLPRFKQQRLRLPRSGAPQELAPLASSRQGHPSL